MKVTRRDLEEYPDTWILFSSTQSKNTAVQYKSDIKMGYLLGPNVQVLRQFNDETQSWEVWVKL